MASNTPRCMLAHHGAARRLEAAGEASLRGSACCHGVKDSLGAVGTPSRHLGQPFEEVHLKGLGLRVQLAEVRLEAGFLQCQPVCGNTDRPCPPLRETRRKLER